MEWIHKLNTWKSREFDPDEIVSWKGLIMRSWVHYMCPTIHVKG